MDQTIARLVKSEKPLAFTKFNTVLSQVFKLLLKRSSSVELAAFLDYV